MTSNDPQPQDLFGRPLDQIVFVYAADSWWPVPPEAVIERGNLCLGNVVFPLKEVRGIKW